MKTIEIGRQVWMQSNLDVEFFRNGDIIPQIISKKAWSESSKSKKPAWCYYENNVIQNDLPNGLKHGKLYNWYAVSDRRGLAPIGWRIPISHDWDLLADYLGRDLAGQKLKSIINWNFEQKGLSEIGFAALPSGYRTVGGGFDYIGRNTFWWCSDEYSSGLSQIRGLSEIFNFMYSNCYKKGMGLSVRCLKDE